jgi:hypothetical protein
VCAATVFRVTPISDRSRHRLTVLRAHLRRRREACRLRFSRTHRLTSGRQTPRGVHLEDD